MSLGSKLKAVLVDLSGTIHIDDFVIPGALEALERYCCRLRYMVNVSVPIERICMLWFDQFVFEYH